MSAKKTPLTLHIKNMAGDIHTVTVDVPVPILYYVLHALSAYDPVTYPLLTTFLFRLPCNRTEEKDGDEEDEDEDENKNSRVIPVFDDDILCVLYRDMVVHHLSSKGRRYRFELPVGHLETPVVFYCHIDRWNLFNGTTFCVRYFSDETVISKDSKALYSTILSVFPSVNPHEWMAVQRMVFTAVDDLLEEYGYSREVEGPYPHDSYAVKDEPFVCDCGSVIRHSSRSMHLNTKKHQAFLVK